MVHKIHGWYAGIIIAALLLTAVLLWPSGCSHERYQPTTADNVPIVRVRILQAVDRVTLTADNDLILRAASDTIPRRVSLPTNGAAVTLQPGGWKIGDLALGTGILTIYPASDQPLSLDAQPYHGTYRLVPTLAPGKFDVVNHVDVESYLQGVLPRELPWHWNIETYKAQAIAARTYALYQCKDAPQPQHWDLNADVRSQVYGGIAAESLKGRNAVQRTRGIVVAYGPRGQERIFPAYYSACCGGVTQAAVHAFPAETYLEPLSDQFADGLCSACPKFNWGPIVIRRDELTRRFRLYGDRRNDSALKAIAPIAHISVESISRFGRPVRFRILDANGTRFSFSGEDLRRAVNTDAPPDSILYSSFVKVIDDGLDIRFVEGHGWGHGVGMCQWCAQARANQGMCHEDIVLAAYPRAKLIKAY